MPPSVEWPMSRMRTGVWARIVFIYFEREEIHRAGILRLGEVAPVDYLGHFVIQPVHLGGGGRGAVDSEHEEVHRHYGRRRHNLLQGHVVRESAVEAVAVNHVVDAGNGLGGCFKPFETAVVDSGPGAVSRAPSVNKAPRGRSPRANPHGSLFRP